MAISGEFEVGERVFARYNEAKGRGTIQRISHNMGQDRASTRLFVLWEGCGEVHAVKPEHVGHCAPLQVGARVVRCSTGEEGVIKELGNIFVSIRLDSGGLAHTFWNNVRLVGPQTLSLEDFKPGERVWHVHRKEFGTVEEVRDGYVFAHWHDRGRMSGSRPESLQKVVPKPKPRKPSPAEEDEATAAKMINYDETRAKERKAKAAQRESFPTAPGSLIDFIRTPCGHPGRSGVGLDLTRDAFAAPLDEDTTDAD